jgi:uncharacterized protein (DUF2267 family)
MRPMETDHAVEQSKRLVSQYERRLITEGSLVSGIADLITPATIDDVMASLPVEVRALMRAWAKSLPDEDGGRVIFWPLQREVRLSFKEWLRQQEQHENGF